MSDERADLSHAAQQIDTSNANVHTRAALC